MNITRKILICCFGFSRRSKGSGRAEKGVDLVVAQRQKNKPIAWSQNGSHALAILKAEWLNLQNAD